ncbi:hypothetical protein FACS1894151_06240 [Spirochaetia bacterium]|nr:hypothetical protein FACS1894151_06240 [Spirochaetia bacterium]
MTKRIMGFIFAVLLVLPLCTVAAQSRGITLIAQDGTTLASFSQSYALVIGESVYTNGWSNLSGVREDVPAVKHLFEEMGFTVETLENADSSRLKAGIETFFNRYGYDEDTRLIVYYAGHGHTLRLGAGRDMGYIVPTDAPDPARDERGFQQRAIPMQQFDTWAKMITSRHVLFMFDSCFSGSVFATSRAAPGIIDYKISQPVRQFIAAGAADETVPDRSIFRSQLEAGLRDGDADLNRDGYVSGSELGDFLQSTVVNYSYNSQHPQYGKIRDAALDKGDFVFVLASVTPQTTTAPQGAVVAAAPQTTIAPQPEPDTHRITGADINDGAKNNTGVNTFSLDNAKRWGLTASYSAPLGFDARYTFFESYKEQGVFFLLPNAYFASAAYFSGNEFGTTEWEANVWSFGLGALYRLRLGAAQRFLLHFGPSVTYDMGTTVYTGSGADLYEALDAQGIAAEALAGLVFRITPALSLGIDAVFHAGKTFHVTVNAGLGFHRDY